MHICNVTISIVIMLFCCYFSKSVEEHSEKRIKTVECQFITLVDFTPGMLHITTHNLHFVPESFTAGTYTLMLIV